MLFNSTNIEWQIQNHPGWPCPDPTLLTTEQLALAINNLKTYADIKIQATREIQEAHLQGHVAEAQEHFKAIDLRFEERDKRYNQLSTDNQTMVSAALASTERANFKMEVNFTKQIDGSAVLISTVEKTLSGKLDDVKSMVTGAISRAEVMATNQTLIDRIGALEKQIAGYQGALLVVGLLASGIPTIVIILLRFLH